MIYQNGGGGDSSGHYNHYNKSRILSSLASGLFRSYTSRKINKDNQKFQMEMALKNQEFQEHLELMRQKHQDESFEKTAQLQREICDMNHKLRLEELSTAYKNQMNTIEYSQLMSSWPLNTPPFILRDESILDKDTKVALRVIIAYSNNEDSKMLNRFVDIIEHELYKFLNQYYSISSQHPVLFYSGGWKDNINGGVAQNSILHYALKSLPTLILTPKVLHNKLCIDITMWGLGAEEYYQDTLYEINFDKKLIDCTEKDVFIKYLKEIQCYFNYAVGWSADILHLIEYSQTPLLPSIIMQEQCCSEHWENLRTHYQQRYLELYEYVLGDKVIQIEDESCQISDLKTCLIPDLSISYLETSSTLIENNQMKTTILTNSMKKWLELRGIEPYCMNESILLNEIIKVANKQDQGYLKKLKAVYEILKNEGYNNAQNNISTINRTLLWLQ